jgi:hypothetical protein
VSLATATVNSDIIFLLLFRTEERYLPVPSSFLACDAGERERKEKELIFRTKNSR